MRVLAFLAVVFSLVVVTTADESTRSDRDLVELFLKRVERASSKNYCYCPKRGSGDKKCYDYAKYPKNHPRIELCGSSNTRSSNGLKWKKSSKQSLKSQPNRVSGRLHNAFPKNVRPATQRQTKSARNHKASGKRGNRLQNHKNRESGVKKPRTPRTHRNRPRTKKTGTQGRGKTPTGKKVSGSTNNLMQNDAWGKGKKIRADIGRKKPTGMGGRNPNKRRKDKKKKHPWKGGKSPRNNGKVNKNKKVEKYVDLKSHPMNDSPAIKSEVSTDYCIEKKKGDICLLIATMNSVENSLCEKEAKVKIVPICESVRGEKIVTAAPTKTTKKPPTTKKATTNKKARTTRRPRKPTRKPKTKIDPKTIGKVYQKDEPETDDTTRPPTSAELSQEQLKKDTDPKTDKATVRVISDNNFLCTYKNPNSPYYGQCFEWSAFKDTINDLTLENLAYNVDVNKLWAMYLRSQERYKEKTIQKLIEKGQQAIQILSGPAGVNLEIVLTLAIGAARQPPCTYGSEMIPLYDRVFDEIIDDCDNFEVEKKAEGGGK